MKSIHSESTDRLFEAILNLKTEDECYAFFEDLCTINELRAMSQRFDVAVLLDKGMNYQEIERTANVSSGTISRIRRAFDFGTGGYSAAIARLHDNK